MLALADAELNEIEREVLERFVAAIQDRYGDELEAVWLFGSRARGERTHDESDIDVLVITRERKISDKALIEIEWEILDALGNPWVLLSARQRTRAWIDDRRAIRSFFLQEVDRDKIVLHGQP